MIQLDQNMLRVQYSKLTNVNSVILVYLQTIVIVIHNRMHAVKIYLITDNDAAMSELMHGSGTAC